MLTATRIHYGHNMLSEQYIPATASHHRLQAMQLVLRVQNIIEQVASCVAT
jgi:hypothetical protein